MPVDSHGPDGSFVLRDNRIEILGAALSINNNATFVLAIRFKQFFLYHFFDAFGIKVIAGIDRQELGIPLILTNNRSNFFTQGRAGYKKRV